MTKIYYIYKFIDNKNNILYIGKTNNINKRINEHFDYSGHLDIDCYTLTHKILYAKLNNKDEASIYEIYLINKYTPIFNKQYNNSSKFNFELPDIKWKDYKINNNIETCVCYYCAKKRFKLDENFYCHSCLECDSNQCYMFYKEGQYKTTKEKLLDEYNIYISSSGCDEFLNIESFYKLEKKYLLNCNNQDDKYYIWGDNRNIMFNFFEMSNNDRYCWQKAIDYLIINEERQDDYTVYEKLVLTTMLKEIKNKIIKNEKIDNEKYKIINSIDIYNYSPEELEKMIIEILNK